MERADTSVVYFLLIYNLRTRELESHESFTDVDEALSVYSATEIEYLGRGYEVVLVGSESIQAVMATHGSYFAAPQTTGPHAGLSFSLS